MECLIPPPVGYKTPPWPRRRDEAWYVNVPYKHLTQAKADQNWVQYDEQAEKFVSREEVRTPALIGLGWLGGWFHMSFVGWWVGGLAGWWVGGLVGWWVGELVVGSSVTCVGASVWYGRAEMLAFHGEGE